MYIFRGQNHIKYIVDKYKPDLSTCYLNTHSSYYDLKFLPPNLSTYLLLNYSNKVDLAATISLALEVENKNNAIVIIGIEEKGFIWKQKYLHYKIPNYVGEVLYANKKVICGDKILPTVKPYYFSNQKVIDQKESILYLENNQSITLSY